MVYLTIVIETLWSNCSILVFMQHSAFDCSRN